MIEPLRRLEQVGVVPVIAEASRRGTPFYPGVITPTDFQTGLKAGATAFKFFPAAAEACAGGAAR